MQIRKIEQQERFDAYRISVIAFHMHIDNVDIARAECAKSDDEDWGAFTDDGKLMAHVINNHLTTYLDGQPIMNGGIGGVSTLPEYRKTGAIRAIFKELLPACYARGEVLSTLYPFNHAFYRKFGYETAYLMNGYSFAPSVLRDYHFKGDVHQYQPGEGAAPYTALYNAFAKQYNLAAQRTDAMTLKPHLEGVDYKDRRFTYMLSENGEHIAFVTFQDIRHDPMAILQVQDLAWIGRRGFHALLGFLGRFTADYGEIRMKLPRGVTLTSLLHSPKTELQTRHEYVYMARVINAVEALRLMRKPQDGSFVIRVTDEYIPQNNGTWCVSAAGVTATDAAPDLCVDIRALAQLIVGLIDLDEAMLRLDVEVCGNEEQLRRVFVHKPTYMAEYY